MDDEKNTLSGRCPVVTQMWLGEIRFELLQRRIVLFDSVFMTIREALSGLFTQAIVDLINGLVSGLLGGLLG